MNQNSHSKWINKRWLANSTNKHRLAFAKAHANEMWQADTLYGPHVHLNGSPVPTRLIAFIDDASRVCCHGQFFPAENVDTLIESIRAAFYKRGVPHALLPAYPGLIVKDSYWRWPERNLAGNAIDFHAQVLGLPFHNAMRQITGT